MDIQLSGISVSVEDWPREDKIRWVQQRINERKSENFYRSQFGCASGRIITGECSERDYQAYYDHEAKGLSFAEIGKHLFEYAYDPDVSKRRAVLACRRVEHELKTGSKNKKKKPLGFSIVAGMIVISRWTTNFKEGKRA